MSERLRNAIEQFEKQNELRATVQDANGYEYYVEEFVVKLIDMIGKRDNQLESERQAHLQTKKELEELQDAIRAFHRDFGNSKEVADKLNLAIETSRKRNKL